MLLRAVAALLEREPGRRSRIVVPIVGGPSGTGLEKPQALADLAAELGLTDVVRFVPPVSQAELARWYAAATLVAVPSYNESFGLVAVEAQATGTPVVAAAVGGLTTAVRDGHSGLLVPGHDTDDWADALRRVLGDDELRARLEAGARRQARAVLVGRHRRGDVPRSTSGPAPRSRRRLSVTRPGAAAPRLPRGQRARLRRAAARPVLVRPARREEAADPGPARRRHPRARRARLRLPPSRREPRAGLRVAAAAQPQAVRRRVRRRPARRHLPRRAAAALGRRDDDELDRLLGAVLTTADESFNTILELGFASSIRKEWEWRTLRGESTAEPRGVPRLARSRRGLRQRRGPARTRPAPVAPARRGSGG